jgi:protein-disulfide isomerase
VNIPKLREGVDVKRFNTECTEGSTQRTQRRIWVSALASVVALFCLPGWVLGQSPAAVSSTGKTSAGAAPTALQKSVEAYLRNLYAFGPNVQLTVSPPKESEVAGLLETTVDLKDGENSQSAKFYLSKDGKYLVRGEISDLSKDTLAETRARIQMNDAPSLGDPKAPITLVEFSDFECPVCRSLHDVLRGMLPNYPQVRVVFKDFPLESLHPWARTAALAGRCAYQQDPKAFWKVYDAIYDQQEVISAANAWTKMADFAAAAGLNADTFKACMASPDAAAAVDASRANGQQLEVGSTPTVFVNGRRLVGADPRLLEQYIKYELAQHKLAKN